MMNYTNKTAKDNEEMIIEKENNMRNTEEKKMQGNSVVMMRYFADADKADDFQDFPATEEMFDELWAKLIKEEHAKLQIVRGREACSIEYGDIFCAGEGKIYVDYLKDGDLAGMDIRWIDDAKEVAMKNLNKWLKEDKQMKHEGNVILRYFEDAMNHESFEDFAATDENLKMLWKKLIPADYARLDIIFGDERCTFEYGDVYCANEHQIYVDYVKDGKLYGGEIDWIEDAYDIAMHAVNMWTVISKNMDAKAFIKDCSDPERKIAPYTPATDENLKTLWENLLRRDKGDVKILFRHEEDIEGFDFGNMETLRAGKITKENINVDGMSGVRITWEAEESKTL